MKKLDLFILKLIIEEGDCIDCESFSFIMQI